MYFAKKRMWMTLRRAEFGGMQHRDSQRLGQLLWVLVAGLLLSACTVAIPTEGVSLVAPPDGQRLMDIAEYDLPTPEPVIVPDVTGVIITEDARANVRGGPALDAPIVAKADPGDTFQITGKSADGEWWQICCVPGPGDAADTPTETAWVSSVVVEVQGNADAVTDITALLSTTLESSWRVEWACGSERCEIKQCTGDITAKATGDGTEQWLQVEHNVSWSEECFDADSWVFEVDRFTGQERSGAFVDDFRYNYWLGVQPGPVTNVFWMDDGRKVAVWCGPEQEFEVPVGEGWTNAVNGTTCHDVRTGELVYVNYTTRWLFTGQYEGQRYERAYFGDYETIEQYLVDTNVELSFIQD